MKQIALVSALSISLVACLVPEGPDIGEALPTAESLPSLKRA